MRMGGFAPYTNTAHIMSARFLASAWGRVETPLIVPRAPLIQKLYQQPYRGLANSGATPNSRRLSVQLSTRATSHGKTRRKIFSANPLVNASVHNLSGSAGNELTPGVEWQIPGPLDDL